jgi:hypothetical protein
MGLHSIKDDFMRWIPLLLTLLASTNSGSVVANHWQFTSDRSSLRISGQELPDEIDPACRETFDAAGKLRDDLKQFAELVSRYAERSQLEFAIGNAERAVARMQCQASTQCDEAELAGLLENVRANLDVVRRLFRENVEFTSKPELFEAFRTMVYSWEALRDSIIL